MNDNKPNIRDSTSVAAGEDDEVERLAKKVGISVGAVREDYMETTAQRSNDEPGN